MMHHSVQQQFVDRKMGAYFVYSIDLAKSLLDNM